MIDIEQISILENKINQLEKENKELKVRIIRISRGGLAEAEWYQQFIKLEDIEEIK